MKDHKPTIAVVVTAYNYAHFLPVCLDSVLDQTRLPDEIVVIDDGSTDATPDVLGRYGDRIKAMRFENGGQAASFNRGAAETNADLVLFLDADDILHPHAVETILLNWAPDVDQMMFELEMIDASGASLGLHPGLSNGALADNRPSLLQTGSYPFPPTSGNVFSRAFLDAATPMPEDRWRISADCYLVRAAALFGRAAVLGDVLGGYRMHFANNYARLGPGGWEEGLRLTNRSDAIDALEALAKAPEAVLGGDADLVRAALRSRAALLRDHGDGHHDEPFDGFDPLLTGRWLSIPELDQTYVLADDAEMRAGYLRGPERSELTLRLPPVTGPMTTDLMLAQDWGCETSVTIDGVPAAILAPGQAVTSLSLPRAPFDAERVVVIAVHSESERIPDLLAINLSAGHDARHPALISRTTHLPAWDALRLGLEKGAWQSAGAGVELCLPSGNVLLSFPQKGPATLGLGLGRARGWLSVEADSIPAFRGRIGDAGQIECRLTVPQDRQVDLTVNFEPDDGSGPLQIESVALGRSDWPALPVSIGEYLVFSSDPAAGQILGPGWSFDGETSPQMAAPEALLTFLVPTGAKELAVQLDIMPLMDLPDGQKAVIGVSQNGEMLNSAEVLGPGSFSVPVPEISPNGRVELVVHAIVVGADMPGAAPIALSAISLDGQLDRNSRPLAAVPTRIPAYQRFLDLVQDYSKLAEARAGLVELIAGSDVALPLLLVGDETRAGEVVSLAEAARGIEPMPDELASFDQLKGDQSDRGQLAFALVALLLKPAWQHPFDGDLSKLPVPFAASPKAIGAYLGEAPRLENAKDHQGYRRYLERLMPLLRDALAEGKRYGRLTTLAAETTKALRMTRTIFADGPLTNLIKDHSAAIEQVLLQDGASLTMAPVFRPGLRRLRVGVLVRDVTDTPEGYALRGMYEGLDPGRFELVLIRMATDGKPAPEFFSQELSLQGLDPFQAVDKIRKLELDIFVTGAYTRAFETAGLIYAHRLAPVQLWHAAVCPTTGGFSSFDGVLTCQASEPEDAEAQYSEPIHWIDGPKQCAYAFPELAADGAAMRGELGLADDNVLLASTAMAHKISDELLGSWAAILQAAPKAVLALAPFAANWSMPYDVERFSHRLIKAGIPSDQVTVLPSLTPDRVAALLDAADLMVDSFPYTGATTICEALARGTPAITLAGGALRQLTGASWIRAYGFDDLVADSATAYEALAIDLANSPTKLADVTRRTKAAAETAPHDDRAGFGAAFGAALWNAAEASGRFPGLAPAEDTPFVPSHTPAAPPHLLRPTKPRLLVILASPRTGSTLLSAILNRTPGVLCHFELFHESMIQFARKTVDDPEALAARNADPMGFLDKVWDEAGAAGVAMMGFKQLSYLVDVTRTLIQTHDATFITLSRENLLAQYSSIKIAEATGQWASHKERPADQVKLEFDAEACSKHMDYQRRVEFERMNILSYRSRRSLFVEYATLNSPHTRARISDHIGIEIPDSAQPDIRKQNDPNILARFTNPDAVEEFLFERQLGHWAREG